MTIVKVKDIVINFQLTGKGEPVILLSGMSSDLSMWSTQVPYLAYDFLVISYDHRGSGRTDAPDEPYSIGGMAEDCFGLMDALGVESAHLVGISMGGMIAQEMAIRRSTRVSSLVLGATSARVPPRQAYILRTMVKAARLGASREVISRFEISWTLSDRYLEDERVAEAVAMVRARRMSAQPMHAMVRQAEAMLDYDSRDGLRSIKAPTLVIAGRKDLMVPLDYCKELASGISGGRLQVIEAAHSLVVDDAVGFSQAITGFLQQVGGRGE